MATCLDSGVLFASCLEQAGLNPLLVFAEGHAFTGCWLVSEDFSSVVVDDPLELRKREQLQELLLFETTLATHRSAPTFKVACQQGALLVEEKKAAEFRFAVDIRRARMQAIRPLFAQEAPTPPPGPDVPPDGDEIWEEPPDFDEDGPRVPPPTQPQGPLARWQRKLLDLSLRNSLLNFRSVKRALVLDAPAPARIEDRLAQGGKLKLLPRPGLMVESDPASQALHQAKYHVDAAKAHALACLEKDEILVGLPKPELDARLTELFRAARAGIEEGGANILFLALGFLAWKRDDDKDGKCYKAPLILLPVVLERKSVKSGFVLRLHDDEPRFNPTLLEMLRQDFQLFIPEVEAELPKDAAGLDVKRIWDAVRHKVKDIQGWEVVEDVVLSTFSFGRYLMWKDLNDRTDLLKQNPVVRHLIDSPHGSYPEGVAFPAPEELDEQYDPATVFCTLPADSSQLAAVMAAARGKDFVLEGPPGTGKSQTIANLIAQCLAEGQTVLFVSQKSAALDVVYRRLRDVRLGDFCLELHSSKARKLDVLGQLKQAWDARGDVDDTTWRHEAERLKALRDELNRYVEHLHRKRHNGLTAYAAIGRILAGEKVATVPLSWPSPDAHDAAGLEALREFAERLDVNAAQVGGIACNPLGLVEQADWSPGWQSALIAAAREMLPLCDEIEAAARIFRQVTGLADMPLNVDTRAHLASLARWLPEAAGHDWRFTLRPGARAVFAKLSEGVTLLAERAGKVGHLSARYTEAVSQLDISGLRALWREATATWWPRSAWLKHKVGRVMALTTETGAKARLDCGLDLELLGEIRGLDERLAGLSDLSGNTDGLWAGRATRQEVAQRALLFAQSVTQAIGGLASDAASLVTIHQTLERLLGAGNAMLEPGGAVGLAAQKYVQAAARFQTAQEKLLSLATFGGKASAPMGETPDALAAVCRAFIEQERRLHTWCAWRKARGEALASGLEQLVMAIEDGHLPVGKVVEGFEVNYCRWWINALLDADDVLRGFVPAEHEARIARFKSLDDRYMQLTRDWIRARLCQGMPGRNDATKNTEWGVLNHEIQKKTKHKPLRQLIAALPTALTKLTPCVLMSPHSIAQYLAADTALFDVVVFDEASQIPVWEAVGAMARGKRVIVVGDPKQLPPTSFFERGEDDADGDVDSEGDLESILDECLGANLPMRSLSWHYRSRHESLIAFSNHRYYGGGLITFPSPVTEDRAVSFHFVEGGVYEKGGARINQIEAKALVADLVGRLKDPAFAHAGLTIGVVTFNAEQQRLIEDLLDQARRGDPSLEAHFADSRLEPVFVKNLESVQGDERDLMYFSITYGPDISGQVSMNFGPLNRDGGQRRLNVAVTRARHELRVFSSLRPERIDPSRTTAKGVLDLKHFLEFAQRGPRALGEAVMGCVGDYESPFEQFVAEALAEKNWQVHPQIGVSRFRIDLGVVHPDMPGRYLAGVECDGATYHRSATARDRDKLREQVLRDLGWEILRVWSIDWWHDAPSALARVDARLREILQQSHRVDVNAETDVATAAEPDVYEPKLELPVSRVDREQPEHNTFFEADLDHFQATIDPGDFYSPGYDESLLAMIRHVINVEGPVKDEVLCRRIAKAHGFQRTGNRIQERIVKLARTAFVCAEEEAGVFFWPGDSWDDLGFFRYPVAGTHRPLDEISQAELRALANSVRERGGGDDDAVTLMAESIGLQRLRAASRQRLETAWAETASD